MSGILIVDDSLFIRYLLRKNVEQLEMELAGECSTAAETLSLYPTLLPEAVIIDYALPDHKGTQIIEQILALDIYARIIFVIPLRMNQIIPSLIGRGVKAVITKPFYPEVVQRTLIEVVFG